ncbi:MAG: CoA transferase [Candidatus Tectimicrobiota bacterium]|nr:MAG: CoA transferase [Candidatus Tectomicrobia bacterium]
MPPRDPAVWQRIRDAEARLQALQAELQQLYREAGEERPPLAGVTIVDLSWAVFGPLATQILSDMGAEVIKVERLAGDIARESQSFYATNRNKQSLAVDLQTPEGREIVLQLAERAHLFVQNFRPGVIERLGLDYDTVRQRNPRIVYCSLSGFGEDGPYRHRGGQDHIIQGMSGLMSIIGWPDGPPTSAGFYVCDVVGAHYAAIAMLLGLYVQQQRGIGQKIELSLLECAIAAQAFPVTWALNHPESPPQKAGSGHWTRRPLYGVYPTKDLPMTLVAVGNERWPRLTAVPGLEALAADPRFATPEGRQQHAAELDAALTALLKQRPRDEWMRLLHEARLLCGPVYTYAELFADPHVQHRGLVQELPDAEGKPMKLIASPIRLKQTPGRLRSAPPALGQHTDALLTRLGYTPAQIAQLRQQRVVL